MLYKDHELINLIKPENEREGALVLEDEKHENNIILEVSGKTYEVSIQICVLLKELLYVQIIQFRQRRNYIWSFIV